METKPRHNRKTIVIGHRNPDTDSICSAIAYAYLKNQSLGHPCEPRRAGELNSETRFVLQKFGVPEPTLCTDVYPLVRDIDIRDVPGVDGMMSLRRAWQRMRGSNAPTLPVVSTHGHLKGVITSEDIATANMERQDMRLLSEAHTPYANLLDALQGKLLVGDENAVLDKGKIIIGASSPDVLENAIEPGDIVILGNRYESQLCAIEMEAGCLIICSGDPVAKTILKLAEERGCAVVATPYDPYATAQFINQSVPIARFMTTENLLTFHLDTPVEDVRRVMAQVRVQYFPVLDERGHYFGVISRRNLLNLQRVQLILVDHNEKDQAVEGFEEAEILEIIDHHRIGTMETNSPVVFRNQPVGCTCTIVAQMYTECGAEIPAQMAGLMCAAILSDTLMFRSPTCTAQDKATAEKLAELAGLDIPAFSEEMFEAGSSIQGKTAAEVFYQDYKNFEEGKLRFGVGQGSYTSRSAQKKARALLEPYLPQAMKEEGVDMMFYLLTDILTQSSRLIYCGKNAAAVVQMAFPGVEMDESSAVLPGVVSRKKQLIPALLTAMQAL